MPEHVTNEKSAPEVQGAGSQGKEGSVVSRAKKLLQALIDNVGIVQYETGRADVFDDHDWTVAVDIRERMPADRSRELTKLILDIVRDLEAKKK